VSAWLWSSALLMGLAGGPHCLAMCGAACTALGARCGGPRPQLAHLAWQAGRLLAYALAGALVASSVGLLARWGEELAWLRPWWVMLHIAAFALGAWMAWQGRVPPWLAAPWSPRSLAAGNPTAARTAEVPRPAAWYRFGLASASLGAGEAGADGGRPGVAAMQARTPADRPTRPGQVLWLRAAGVGAAWVALPCGLLQSALVVAALGSSAWEGALVMACFALGSGISLWWGPAMWTTLTRRLGRGEGFGRLGPVHAVRLAGVMLALGSAWAIGHQFVAPWVVAYCA
jgi:sulfite exporter TauE/SafE